jgi:hypothetical protein
MACSTGCPTPGSHKTYGECLRAKNLQSSDRVTRDSAKAWDAELNLYRSAVEQGIQPDSTKRASVERAIKLSDQAGAAYGNDFHQASPMGNI